MIYNYGKDLWEIIRFIKRNSYSEKDWEWIVNKFIDLWGYKYANFIKDISFSSVEEALKGLIDLHKRGKYPEGPFVIYKSHTIDYIITLLEANAIIDDNISNGEKEYYAKALKAGRYAYYFLTDSVYSEMIEIIDYFPNNHKKDIIYKILFQFLNISYLGKIWYDFVEYRKPPYLKWYVDELKKIKNMIVNDHYNPDKIYKIDIPYKNIKNYNEPFEFNDYKFHHPDYKIFNKKNTISDIYETIKNIFIQSFPIVIEGPTGVGKTSIVKKALEESKYKYYILSTGDYILLKKLFGKKIFGKKGVNVKNIFELLEDIFNFKIDLNEKTVIVFDDYQTASKKVKEYIEKFTSPFITNSNIRFVFIETST